MRPLAAALWLAAALPAAGEDILRLPIGDPARRDRDVPLVLDAITDTGSGALLSPAELPARLTGARILIVGEEHTAMDAHRVERRVIEELHRAGRRVSIGLEMYPYTEQAALDAWTDGKTSEETFVEASRWYKNWGYNWAYYRDIFLFARDHRLRLFAVNAPREVVSAVRQKGFSGLTPEEAAHIPTPVDTKNAEHRRLFQASFEDASFHSAMTDAEWQSMLDAQCTWDATMGHHALRAAATDDDPRAILVLLAGAGHVQYGLGIERQLRQRFAGGLASLIPVAVADEKKGPVREVRASYASFVWGIPLENDPQYPDLGVSTRPSGGEPPLTVIHVEKDSPGARAGLRAGDGVISLDGGPVPDRATLNRALSEKRWGDAAVFRVRRGDETATVTVLFRREPPPGAEKPKP